MIIRLILFTLLGYFLIKTVRQWFFGAPGQPKVKKSKRPNEEDDFQQKNKSNIEDADFEELE